jgi:autophagy-related protein 17
MAQHLTSLTTHFDMCVKAVRATEGGAALARRRAAEATDDGDPVSISGVITEHESDLPDLEPMDPQELAEIVQVVLEDAPEVDEVVAEIQAVLQQMEQEFGALKEQADRIRDANSATLVAFRALEEIGARLPGYVAAEHEFEQRWVDEKEVILGKLDEMDGLRRFYEGYASAYGSLLLEVERRRAAEDKIQATLRKARENVDNLVEADRKQREHFRQEVGEFLPTDLWVGMNNPLTRWELVPVREGAGAGSETRDELTTPTIAKPAGKGKGLAR